MPSDSVQAVDPYPGIDTSGADWQKYFDNMLKHLSNLMAHHQVFSAIQYAATSIMTFMGNYTEDYQMGGQGKLENDLTAMQNLRNKIENDFDEMKHANDPALGQEALDYFYKGYTDSKGKHHDGLKTILEDGENKGYFSSDFVDEVEDEFMPNSVRGASGPIFGGCGQNDGAGVAKYWNDMWNPALPDTGPPDTTQSTQEVTNAFSAVSSDFSSQSSTAQSKIKYYEANDEQYKSMSHDVMSEIVNEEKQSNTAMQSASS